MSAFDFNEYQRRFPAKDARYPFRQVPKMYGEDRRDAMRAIIRAALTDGAT